MWNIRTKYALFRYPEYDLALAAAQVYLPELQGDRYRRQDDIQE